MVEPCAGKNAPTRALFLVCSKLKPRNVGNGVSVSTRSGPYFARFRRNWRLAALQSSRTVHLHDDPGVCPSCPCRPIVPGGVRGGGPASTAASFFCGPQPRLPISRTIAACREGSSPAIFSSSARRSSSSASVRCSMPMNSFPHYAATLVCSAACACSSLIASCADSAEPSCHSPI